MVKEQSFEDALVRLEEIVQMLEDGDVPLEESVSKYKEGIKITKLLKKKLEKAEKELLKLSRDEDGGFQLEIMS